jgi:hypothetical protein
MKIDVTEIAKSEMINKMGTTSGDRHHRIHLQGIG